MEVHVDRLKRKEGRQGIKDGDGKGGRTRNLH